ncbi:MAG TPA: hypothetical protein VHX16_01025 [Chloroflexota bacterium]|jgi:hypothetical protein|nr:hypothetical protein [Chloroflexota bacterium]
MLTVASTAGYAGQVAGSVEITVAKVKCHGSIPVKATVFDIDGDPIAGQPVAWAFASTPSTADTIQPVMSTTNARGVAKTRIKLSCIPGNRQLRATADDVSGTAVLILPDQGITEGAKQPVAMVGDAPERPHPGNIPLLLGVIATMASGGLVWARLARQR